MWSTPKDDYCKPSPEDSLFVELCKTTERNIRKRRQLLIDRYDVRGERHKEYLMFKEDLLPKFLKGMRIAATNGQDHIFFVDKANKDIFEAYLVMEGGKGFSITDAEDGYNVSWKYQVSY